MYVRHLYVKPRFGILSLKKERLDLKNEVVILAAALRKIEGWPNWIS